MEKRKHESDDAYWGSVHTGFVFDDGDWQQHTGDSKLSEVIRKDANQVDLLRWDGLTAVAENRSTKEFTAFDNSHDESATKLAKSCSPFAIHPKVPSAKVQYRPEDTIKNMILGLEYSLEGYKGKRDKIELLNAAVKSHDGNAILEVVLYLRDTLKKSIFQREVVAYADAVNVYLAYLKEDHEIDELTNMLLLLDKVEDAAILKYESAVVVENPERKLKWIENCLSTHFQTGSVGTFLLQSVEEHKTLLEEQINLQKSLSDLFSGNGNMLLFEKLTGKKSLIDSSVLCSLIFYCLSYYNSSEKHTNPDKIKSDYNLSKKQYTWAVLRALAVSGKWADIDSLFKSKNWLGGTKVRSCIAYRRVLEVLSKAEAPNEVLNKYVSYVEMEEEKLDLAKKYGCYAIVIEIYKNNKDRLGLMEYKASLVPNSIDFCSATEVLNNLAIRWKN